MEERATSMRAFRAFDLLSASSKAANPRLSPSRDDDDDVEEEEEEEDHDDDDEEVVGSRGVGWLSIAFVSFDAHLAGGEGRRNKRKKKEKKRKRKRKKENEFHQEAVRSGWLVRCFSAARLKTGG